MLLVLFDDWKNNVKVKVLAFFYTASRVYNLGGMYLTNVDVDTSCL